MGDAEALQEASDGFFLAAEYGRSDVIKALADHGRGQLALESVVDAATGRSPLHVAVASGKTDALRVLLAVGFPPDVESVGGADADAERPGRRRRCTPYALARELQAEDLVMVFHQFLIQQVAGNDAAGVERMLAAGIDVSVTDGASHSSLLHWAVSCQAGDVLAYLLARTDVQDQMLVNRRNGDGATPLHLAAHSNQVECVRMLLEAGSNAQIRGEAGFSAGKVAAELATSPPVLELFKRQAALESGTNGENTPNATNPLELCEIDLPQQRSEAVNRESNPRSTHDDSTCEHAAQISKLKLQLEEKDLLINQLKKTIEDLVIEAHEIQKLGEERVMLEYVRKLREDKSIADRRLGDANDYIGVQQEQISDLKSQIRRMCDAQQVLYSFAEVVFLYAVVDDNWFCANNHSGSTAAGQWRYR